MATSAAASSSEWTRIDQIWLTHDADGSIFLDGMVEAKGEARRVMARLTRGGERRVIARWRDGVPASVRIISHGMVASEHRQRYERQLIAYARGLDDLQVPEGITIDTREPESIAEDRRP